MSHGMLALAGLFASTLAGCATDRVKEVDLLATQAPNAQLFGELGTHTRIISTSSPQAQEYFNEGLAWMYAFNHDEAIRSFARAATLDPTCAMAWWGIAVAEGPNYNDPVMTEERSSAAWIALREASARAAYASSTERDLIEALSHRYANPWPEDRSELDAAYAEAMARVWAAHPDDSDIGTLYAEAMMVRRPWMLYSADQEPEGETPTIVATLERVMTMDPGNPGGNHLYIHAVEPSANPDLGIAAANRLGRQVPSSGHLNHMPSHIYVQTGMWDESIHQNRLAMDADDAYLARAPDQGLQHMYMVHNAHMLAYSAMMVGREEEAMVAARDMWADVSPEKLEAFAPFIDLWMCSVYDVQKRFGRWDDLLAEPAPPAYLPITTAIWRAHRAIAYAAQKDFDGARREFGLFHTAKAAIPEESVFGSDPTYRILEVCEHFVPGEIALQSGDLQSALEHLERAVAAEDELAYGEPPQWLQPTRHTLGAVYQMAGRYEDAERVYRDDLKKWRGNGWSLFGLSRALAAQGKATEAAAALALHEVAWAKADAPTQTSCVCVPEL